MGVSQVWDGQSSYEEQHGMEAVSLKVRRKMMFESKKVRIYVQAKGGLNLSSVFLSVISEALQSRALNLSGNYLERT